MKNRTLLKWQDPGLQQKYFSEQNPASWRSKAKGFLIGLLLFISMFFLSMLFEVGWPNTARLWQGLILISISFGAVVFFIIAPIQIFANRQPTYIHIKQKRIERRSWTSIEHFPYKEDMTFSFAMLSIGTTQTDALVIIQQPQNAIIFEMSPQVSRTQILSILEQHLTYEPTCPLGSDIAFDKMEFE